MKKTFFKSVVATAVVTAAMALSSVAVMADNSSSVTFTASMFELDSDNKVAAGTYYFSSNGEVVTSADDAYFTVYLNGSREITGNYMRLNSSGKDYIGFTTTEDIAAVTINAASSSSSTARTVTWKASDSGSVSGDTSISGTTAADYNWDISGSDTYKMYSNGNTLIYSITVTETSSGATQYDKSSFGDVTTSDTLTVPDTVQNQATVSDWTTEVGIDTENQPTDDDGEPIATVDADSNATIDGFTFVSVTGSSTRAFRYSYTNETIQTNGSTNANGRYIEFTTTEDNEVIKLVDFYTQNGSGRYAFISSTITGTIGSSDPYVEAPTDPTDVTMVVPSAGTYYVCFTAGVQFTAIELYSGKDATAPTISLSEADTTANTGYITYTGTIAGDASESVTVTGINFVTAKGYTDSKETAVTNTIDKVYYDGANYYFAVIINADTVNALPGLEVQANVVTDAGTLYSDIIEYAYEEE